VVLVAQERHPLRQDHQDQSTLEDLVDQLGLEDRQGHPHRQDRRDLSTLEDLVDQLGLEDRQGHPHRQARRDLSTLEALVVQERHSLQQDQQDPEHLCDLEDLRARWDLADQ
jgi:sulfur carrier protein ThiS